VETGDIAVKEKCHFDRREKSSAYDMSAVDSYDEEDFSLSFEMTQWFN